MAATHRRLFLVRTDSDSAKGENMSDDLAYFYTKTLLWNTASALTTDLDGTGPRPASTLLGHNGQHKIALVEVNGQPSNAMRFQKKPQGQEWQNDSSNVQTTEQTVGNLLIESVTTNQDNPASEGAIVRADYFKFNAESENNSLAHPTITFKIKDEGDPHRYKWRVRVRSTDKDDDWGDSILISGVADEPGTITAQINAPNTPGQTQVSDMSSNANTNPQAYAPLEEWGTYTFDISVEEVDGEGTPLGDPMSYRSQKLFIPKQMPDGSGRGHGGKFTDEANGSESYAVHYYFS